MLFRTHYNFINNVATSLHQIDWINCNSIQKANVHIHSQQRIVHNNKFIKKCARMVMKETKLI
jgi:hypothetical protein